MPEPDDPPPRKYVLKDAEFERVNAPRGTDAPSADHDVFALLADVRKREAAAGLDTMKEAALPKYRRRRDYLVLLIAGNAFMLLLFCVELFIGFQVFCLAAQMPGEFNRLVYYVWHDGLPMFFLPAMCMTGYSGALTWLMFGVMNRY